MRRMMMTTCTKTLSLLRYYLKKKTTMANLPPDIIMVILSKLPVKSISRFRCVCKLWNGWFKNPKFIKMHSQHAIQNYRFSVLLASYDSHGFQYYSIDFDETNHPIDTFRFTSKCQLHLVSCDGLIGSCDFGIMICLLNASTLEYKYIPTLNNESVNRNSFSRYGVLYDWKIDDYKLLKLVADTEFSVTSEVWVCRLGSNSWDSIGNIPYNLRDIRFSEKPLNGIIHWIGNSKVIVSFDIVEERFEERIKEIQIPCCYLDDGLYSYKDMRVGLLGEDLYLSVNARHERNIDLWVMTDYGVIDSWTKIFSLSKDDVNFDRLLPLHYLYKNCEILLQGVCPKGKQQEALLSYDLNSGRLVTLDIPCIPNYFYATTFVGSLVSLNSGKFLKATKVSKVDFAIDKFLLLTVKLVEFVESGYLKLTRLDRYDYLFLFYAAVNLLGSGYYLYSLFARILR